MHYLVDLSYISYKWAFAQHRWTYLENYLKLDNVKLFMDSSFSKRKSIHPWYKTNRENENIQQKILRNEAKIFQSEIYAKYANYCISKYGYEADDLIAIYTQEYKDCIIISEDHDFLQLSNVTLVNQMLEEWNISRIKTKLPIKQGRSYLAYQLLMGCVTDTIPRITFSRDRTTAPYCFNADNPLQTAIEMLPENLCRASLDCLLLPSPLFTNEDSIQVALRLEY